MNNFYHFTKGDKYIDDLIAQSFEICRSKISKRYIKYIIENFEFGWMHVSPIAQVGQKRKRKTENRIYSFILCRTLENPNGNISLYVDLVCNREGNSPEGKQLLQNVENFARNNANINAIYLNGIVDLVKYYEKLGYIKGSMIDGKDDIVYQMIKWVEHTESSFSDDIDSITSTENSEDIIKKLKQ